MDGWRDELMDFCLDNKFIEQKGHFLFRINSTAISFLILKHLIISLTVSLEKFPRRRTNGRKGVAKLRPSVKIAKLLFRKALSINIPMNTVEGHTSEYVAKPTCVT